MKKSSFSLLRSIISVCIVFAMIVSLFPVLSTPVKAAEDISGTNALEVLGIDPSAMPSGFDPNSTDHPYGRDIVTMNPVYELYVSDTTTVNTKLFGHNKSLEQTVEQFRTTEDMAMGDDFEDFEAAVSVVDSGNFVGPEAAGHKGQIVTVITGDLNENGGLLLYINDPVAKVTGDVWTLLDETKTIGNNGDEAIEDFVESPYLMKNYLQVATGDFDNNGVDEIAVYIAEQNNSRVEVYRLKITEGMAADAYRNQNNWEKAWTYYFNESPYVSNMVSLTSGDFSRDGTDDLALTWGYYFGPDNNNECKAAILFGQSGNMLRNMETFNLNYNSAGIVRAAFAYGDIDGDAVDELILGGQLSTDIASGNLSTRFLASYIYKGETIGFQQIIAENFDLFKTVDGELLYPAMERNGLDNKLYSLPAMPVNIATVSLKGYGHASHIYMDSILIENGESGFEIIKAFDIDADFNINIELISGKENPLAHYVEYGVVSADFFGSGIDTVRLMQYYIPFESEPEERLWFLPFTLPDLFPLVVPDNGETRLVAIYDLANIFSLNGDIDIEAKNLDDEGGDFPEGFKYSFCKANTDYDTYLIEYTGNHYFEYTDPEILAVIASPPYFSDLDNAEFDSFYMVSETSYSETTGSVATEMSTQTISMGGYIGLQASWKYGGVTEEWSYKHGETIEASSSETLEQTISYSTSAGEDAIAFYSIPIETFVYKMYRPVTDGDGLPVFDDITGEPLYETQFMSRNFPKTASVRVLPLDTYENIAVDFKELPTIAGNALTHTIGVPGSYPSHGNGFTDVYAYDGDPAVVGFGNGSVTQEISMSEDEGNSVTKFHALEISVGGYLGKDNKISFGYTVGGEYSTGKSMITTNGNSFTGKIYNMPLEAESYGYGFSWRLFTYIFSNEGNDYPVVNYIVTDVTTPAALPVNFQQDMDGTTDSQIKLTWSYDKPAAGFQLYRFYEFPDGSGSYELAFIPAASYDGDAKYYEFVDSGLDTYTEYDYQIQVIGTSLPGKSILSEVCTARTKTNTGYPDIILEGLDGGNLEVYSDTPKTVTAVINNIEDYSQSPKYQWQKLTSEGWVDISGEDSDHYVFHSGGLSDEGQYRCRVNAIYGGYYISAYSDIFTVSFFKITPMIVDGSFTVIDSLEGDVSTEISIQLQSAQAGHYNYPSGNLIFILKTPIWPISLIVDLVPVENGISEAKYSWEGISLPEGVYEIQAYYPGDNVYKSLISETTIPYLSGSDSGYYIPVGTFYYYGETLAPTLKNIEKIDGITVENPITDTSGITYDVVRESIDEDGETVSEIIQSFTDNIDTVALGTGLFMLRAKVDGSVVTTKPIYVRKRYIKIGIEDQNMVIDSSLAHPDNSILTIENGYLVGGHTFDDLKLKVIATNTAGKEITINGETPAGSYTIIGAVSEDEGGIYNNYQIQFTEGTYILNGHKYSVEGSARTVNGKDVATIELLYPEGNENWTTQYSGSTTLVFIANPNNGYSVKNWYISYDGGEPIKQDINSQTLSIIMPDQNIEVEVELEITQNTLNYVKTNGGDLSCISDTVFVNGGVAVEGAEFTFRAEPYDGYHFKEWQKIELGKSVAYPEGISDTEGNSTCTIAMGGSNTTLYAIFERDDYVLTLDENLQASYLWDDDGDITTDHVTRYVESGSEIKGDTEVTVSPKPGYVVPEDAVWYRDGYIATEGTTADDNQSYIFNMTNNTDISVALINEQYSVELILGGPGTSVNSVAKYINDIPASSLIDISGGSKLEFVAEPGYGYEFSEWIVTGSPYTESKNSMIIEALGEDTQVEAVFKDSDGYDITVLFGSRGTMTYTKNDGTAINLVSGDIIDVFNGDTVILTADPEINFMVENWKINGILNQSHEKTWTLENIDNDMIVLVNFAAKTYATVTYGISGTEGAISATSDGIPFESGNQSIGNGSTLLFTATPDENRMVDHWSVNYETVMTQLGTKFIDNVLEISALSGDTDVDVYFRDVLTHSVEWTGENLTATIDYSPDSPEARAGASAIFTVTADDGFRVAPDESMISGNDGPVNGFDSFTRLNDNDGVFVVNAIEGNLSATLSVVGIYTLNITPSTGGEITLSASTAVAGEEITLTAVPDSGMTFSEWIVEDETGNTIAVSDINSMTTTMTMPSGNIIVSAEFELIDDGSGGGTGGGGGGGWIIVIRPPQIYPVDFIIDDSTVRIPLTDKKNTLSDEAVRELIELGSSRIIIIEGNGVKIIIPAGALGEGADINSMIPDVLDVTPGPHMVVAYTDSEGVVHIIPWSITEDGLVTFIAEGQGTYSVISNEITFLDTIGHWGEEWISFVAAREMFNGTGEGNFSPELPMNRSMIVTVLHRLVGLHEAEPSDFSDVLEDQWYTEAVYWAAANGISTGNERGEFGVDVNITREELAVMLYRYSEYIGEDRLDEGSLEGFTDTDEISEYAVSAMGWTTNVGIIKGRTITELDPKGQATRAEVTTMLARYIKWVLSE